MSASRYPVDQSYFVARETHVIVLNSSSGTTAVSIGAALKPGFRRSVVSSSLKSEDVGARCAVELYDGVSATVRDYLSAADNESDFSGIRVDGAGEPAGFNTAGSTTPARPTYKLTASIAGAGRAVLVLECVIESLREAPPTYLA